MTTIATQQESEIDRICEEIDSCSDELRDAQRGQRVQLGTANLTLVSLSRNAVYRISAPTTQSYVKLTRLDRQAFACREQLGARSCVEIAAACPAFRAPAYTRVSYENGYVLNQELCGKYLSSTLYRAACCRGLGSIDALFAAYRQLGTAVATMHRGTVDAQMPAAAILSPLERLSMALSKKLVSDPLVASLQQLVDDSPNSVPTCFIHGNLRRENILWHDGKISLLDFETCGAGSIYSDLSMLGCNFGIVRSAVVFPWRTIFRAWNEFLRGYRQVRDYDRSILVQQLAMQLGTQYLWLLQKRRVTVARIPVLKFRLANTIRQLLRGELELAFPGVEF